MKNRLKIMKMVSVSSMILLAMFLTACGGDGGDSGGGISYTGITTPATIDEYNAVDIATGAYQGGQTATAMVGMSAIQSDCFVSVIRDVGSGDIGRPRTLEVAQALEDSLRRVDFMYRSDGTILNAITTVTETVAGDCGGSGSYTISINDQTGEFSGSFNYSSYCNQGVSLSGNVSFSGLVDVNTGNMVFNFSFDNLTSTSGSDSFTLDGTISYDVSGSTTTTTMTMLLQDNNTLKVYWVKDYALTLTEGVNYEVTFKISGYYYDPDYGYVTISTPTPFVIYYGYSWPSDGVLVVTGDGNTKARLTVLSSATCQVEADTNGDGSYDWDSGVLYWSEL
jgi:hypothetical protein